mmetsp:Transcript_39376/g.92845  ORF Transcript_39376/g.92845 Transcript_39376/m.92845 type:complete len:351 (-) Transcript_39376:217-1269(-)|eukprot:2066633-Rhodomonas_salina.2
MPSLVRRKLRVEAASASYETDKYVANLENLREVLARYGVAILPGLLNEEEIQKMNEGMWTTLEEMTSEFSGGAAPIDRQKKETWENIQELKPAHGFMIRNWGVGHARYAWDIRGNKKVCEAFAVVHQTPPAELITSFDAVSVLLPDSNPVSAQTSPELWLHTDQRFNSEQDPCHYSVQAWVTGYDVVEGSATLALLEGSHKHHAAFAHRFGLTAHSSNWWQLEHEEHFAFLNRQRQCNLRAVCCPAGSMVLFDSRLFHSGMGPPSGTQPLPRHVVYVCMTPREWCTEGDLCKRCNLFFNGRMTGHIPHVPDPAALFPRGQHGVGAARVRAPSGYAVDELTVRMRTLVPLE